MRRESSLCLTVPRRRFAAALAALSCIAALAAGCETAAQKCAKAREAATSEWAAYGDALERARMGAAAAQKDAQQGLSAEVEPRLAPIAQKIADSKYPRSSEAWLRAYRIAYEDTCTHDTECDGLKNQLAEAKGTIEDFADRVPLARAAQRAMSGDVEAAKVAANAAIPHPEFPQLKEAQQLTHTMYERCKDVPAAKPSTP
jgi:hypothetical protein